MKTIIALVLIAIVIIPALIADEIDRKGKKKW